MKKREGVYNLIVIGAGTHLTPRAKKIFTWLYERARK